MRNLRKTIALALAVLLMALLLPWSGLGAQAEESSVLSSFLTTGKLQLDTENRYAYLFSDAGRYEVMEKGYGAGYAPVQRTTPAGGSKLYAILPLLPDGIQPGSRLTVTVDRPGEGFAFTTLREEFVLTEDTPTYNSAPVTSPVSQAPTPDPKPDPSAKNPVYLVGLALPLAAVCPSGVYSIPVRIAYTDAQGAPAQETVTLYAQVSGLDPQPTVTATPAPTPSQSTLVLDDENVYPGMDLSYGEGYQPVVEDGAARILMPLVATGAGLHSAVTVTPGLGDASHSPFVYANYQSTVRLASYSLPSGTQDAYLIDLSLPLTQNRINGRYPVTLTVDYADLAGTKKQAVFTVYVTITDGRDPEDGGEEDPASLLSLDSANIYPGMNASYGSGYTPVVENGKARIVLPMVSGSDLAGCTLTVTPNLGETATSPFVYANYRRTLSYGPHATAGGKTVQGFLLDLTLPLIQDRVNGKYPVVFTVSGKTPSGGSIAQEFTVYVTITDGAPGPDDVVQSPLSIESGLVFPGMPASYAQGYIPTVSGGAVRIVLPLTASAPLYNNEISITPDLGDPSSSPFVYANYEQTVRQAPHTASDGSKMTGYLVDLRLPLASGRVNGRYPVTLKARFRTDAQTVSEQSFLIYVTITDGKDPNAGMGGGGGGGGGGIVSQSKVILSSYSIAPNPVQAGSAFEVKLMLQNTSESRAVKNIKFTYKGEQDTMTSVDQTNTKYFDSIGPGETLEVTLNMAVTMDVEPKPQTLLLGIEYEDNGATLTVNDEILVQVEQPNRMELDTVNIPSSAYLNDVMPVTMNVFNMGRNTLYNVLAKLEVPGLTPEGSVFIGTMEPGTSKTAEFMVTYSGDPYSAAASDEDAGGMDGTGDPDGMDSDPSLLPGAAIPEVIVPESGMEPTVDTAAAVSSADPDIPTEDGMGSADGIVSDDGIDTDDGMGLDDGTGDTLLGPVSGRVLVTFEDENGTVFTQEIPVSTSIEPPRTIDVGGLEPEPEEPKATQWWVSAAIAGGVLAALGVAVILLAKRRRRKVSSYENEVA